jgi:hypothetical protein
MSYTLAFLAGFVSAFVFAHAMMAIIEDEQ